MSDSEYNYPLGYSWDCTPQNLDNSFGKDLDDPPEYSWGYPENWDDEYSGEPFEEYTCDGRKRNELNEDTCAYSESNDEIIKNLDFTVKLERVNDNSVISVNFNAIWKSDEFDNLKCLFNRFKEYYDYEEIIRWENCDYYVIDIQEN